MPPVDGIDEDGSHDTASAHIARLQEESRRLREEFEACVVLVLQLDANRSRNEGPAGAQNDVSRFAARLGVLEESHTIRIQTVTERLQASLVLVEDEIKDLWRFVKPLAGQHQPSTGTLSKNAARVEQQPAAPAPIAFETPSSAVKFEHTDVIDELMVRMSSELGQATSSLEKRVSRLEESLARVEAIEVSALADRQRAGELERMVEIVTQKRREDKLELDSQLREMSSRVFKIDNGGSWGKDADALRTEIADIRLTKLPQIFEQSTQTSRVLAEGLKALRQEFYALPTSGRAGAEARGGLGIEASEQLAVLEAELDEVRRQLGGGAEGGIEGRLMMLRADVSAELESALRQTREAWADLSRRISGLEPWKEEHATLHAEVRSMRYEREEDRSRMDLSVRTELDAIKASIERGLQTAKNEAISGLREGGNAALRSSSQSPRRVLDLAGADSSGRLELPRVRISGSRVEWSLSGAALRSCRDYGGGLLVSAEFEVAGVPCRLKFFPDGSALRRERGFSSLYLLSMASVEIKFRLFAGSYQTPVLTCEYGRKRDQGRHDFVALDAVLDDDGSILLGADIIEVRGIRSGGGGSGSDREH